MRLGDIIRQKRLDQGLTLRGFAKKIGISAMYLSEIERCKKVPFKTPVMFKIINGLRIESDVIMNAYEQAHVDKINDLIHCYDLDNKYELRLKDAVDA